jgi:bifunctional DNA-binding transcriptional regulator/antitoxin component of YhaV-PrlF toxin-antitoxin module
MEKNVVVRNDRSINLPLALCQRLGIRPGDNIEFSVICEGVVVMASGSLDTAIDRATDRPWCLPPSHAVSEGSQKRRRFRRNR